MVDDFEIIHAYTRQQAIEDGMLIDVSEMASELGFKYHTAVTSRVWHEIIVPDEESKSYGQSEQGRLWDVLWMLKIAIKKQDSDSDCIKFQLYVHLGRKAKLVTLKAICSGGDDGEPVVTVMMPDED